MSKRAGVVLNVSNLEKSFGQIKVLKKINLAVNAGEFIAIIGKSGCGKSTLLRHIAGLEVSTNGQIIQDDLLVSGLNKTARIMFQDPRLLPWLSVLENVGIGTGLKKDWQRTAQSAIAQVGLGDRGNDWPSVLSGGQRQRIALARALAAEPTLLLLDEPLGALDALTRHEMQGLIEGLWQKQGFTTILVTHDVSEAIRLADRVILIEEGKVTLDLSVEIPRPRKRTNHTFVALEEKLLQHLTGQFIQSEAVYESNKSVHVG